jgi:hypothetical protein
LVMVQSLVQRHRKEMMRINYKDYHIEAFERENGCWRAKITASMDVIIRFNGVHRHHDLDALEILNHQSSLQKARSTVMTRLNCKSDRVSAQPGLSGKTSTPNSGEALSKVINSSVSDR